jgi:hypothetical protein
VESIHREYGLNQSNFRKEKHVAFGYLYSFAFDVFSTPVDGITDIPAMPILTSFLSDVQLENSNLRHGTLFSYTKTCYDSVITTNKHKVEVARFPQTFVWIKLNRTRQFLLYLIN